MVEWLAGNRIIGTSAERTISDVLPDVTTDGSYTVLKYKTNGKFIPKSAFNVEYLVVAGGGSGAVNNGGGGAGGYLTNFGGTALGVTAQAYTITVGAGGAGSGYTGNRGNSGGNSVFSTITSTGGGGGGCELSGQIIGGNGGSGGGGGYPSGTSGGSASPSGQGNAGGTSGNQQIGGGGGGSSAVGSNASGNNAGNGGNGTANSITGSSVTYSAGGGGGAGTASGVGSSGGSGGIGGSGSASNGIGGTAKPNTGSGGGGSADGSGTSGNGSSGVVILRFLTSGSVYELSSVISKSSGGWKEVGRKVVGTAGKTIDVSGLDNKRYYMILTDAQVTGGTMQVNHRIGRGSYENSGYSHRRSDNGETDAYVNTANEMAMENLTSAYPRFTVSYLSNTAGKEKLNIGTLVADDSGSLERSQCVNKWTGTTDVNQIQAVTEATGNFAVGAELVILGWDEDDTHTDNFWEELASADVTSSGIDVSFTAKKYLMVQYQCTLATWNSNSFGMRFNGVTSNYSRRFSENGVKVNPASNQNKIILIHSGNKKLFGTAFIINNASKNKLLMCDQVGEENTAGAGYAPFRWEFAGKSTLQDQITSIQLLDTVANLTSGHIKVWGHD